MDSNPEEIPDAPSAHPGTKWEIILVTVFVLVIAALLGATWFQIRRRKQRRLQIIRDAEPETRSRLCSESNNEKCDSAYSGLAVPVPIADPPRRPKFTQSMESSSSSSYHERHYSARSPGPPPARYNLER